MSSTDGGNQSEMVCPVCEKKTTNLPRHIHSSTCKDTKQATLREAILHE